MHIPETIPPFAEWHHYAATYDGTKYDIYIDGVRIDGYDRVSPGPIDTDDNPLAIGRDNRGYCTQRNMPSTLDEATVWNRVLSEAEIKQLMAGDFLAVDPAGKLATTWAVLKSQ